MTTAAQKQRELYFVQRLKSLLSPFPSGAISQPDPPAPDVVIQSGTSRTGIEVTELLWDADPVKGSPIKKTQSLRESVVGRCTALWKDGQYPPAFVTVQWKEEHPQLSKHEVGDHAANLVAVVSKHLPGPAGHTFLAFPNPGYKDIPPTVAAIGIHTLAQSSPPLWTVSSGGPVPRLDTAMAALNVVVSAKNGKVGDYRTACDMLWLLVVAEGGHQAAHVIIDDESSPTPVTSAFDRVFLIDLAHDRLVEFPVQQSK